MKGCIIGRQKSVSQNILPSRCNSNALFSAKHADIQTVGCHLKEPDVPSETLKHVSQFVCSCQVAFDGGGLKYSFA